jgi:DNA-binding CsgD family transcriptional regulator/tetratricopeptide (TPR) repeat protein
MGSPIGGATASAPRRLGRLVGRDQELRALRELALTGPQLITVTGLSGVGKTRLVQEAVGDLAAAWFRPGGLDNISSLIPSIERRAEALLMARVDGTHLIVIDSLDDPSIVPELVAVLDRFDHLRVVITSRGRIGVQGEMLFRVLPLQSPPNRAAFDPAQAGQWSAVECFVQAALRVTPTFELSDANLDGVLELLHLCGGLPLAIELAAQWLRVCDLDELVDRARTSMEPFSTASADLPADQQDLRSSILATVAALAPDDLEVLAALAHLGPVSPAGLSAGLSKRVSLSVLGRLVDRNIVESGMERGRAITLHPLIRQVVVTGSDGSDVQLRFVRWLIGEVRREAPRLVTADSRAAFAVLDALAADFNAALELLPLHPEDVAEFVGQLTRVWLFTQGRQMQAFWCRKALEAIDSNSPHRGTLLVGLSMGAVTPDPIVAAAFARAAISAAGPSGDVQVVADAVASLALANHIAGNWEEVGEFETALALCIGRGLTRPLGKLLGVHAMRLVAKGDHVSARALLIETIERLAATDDVYSRGQTLLTLANVHTKLGEVDAAMNACRNAILLGEQLDSRWGLVADAHAALCGYFTEIGRFPEAIEHARLAVAAYEDDEAVLDLAQGTLGLAYCLACSGNHGDSRAEFSRSIELLRASNQVFLGLVACATLAVCPPPVRPDLRLCAQIIATIESTTPGFIAGQTGYWAQMLATLQHEVEQHPPANLLPCLTPDEVFDEVLAHLATPTESPLPMGLTAREAEVLMLVALGATDREIADELHVGVRTINSHVSAILRKLGADSRRQAAAWCRKNLANRQ